MLRELARAYVAEEITALTERAIRAEVRTEEQAGVIAEQARTIAELRGALAATPASGGGSVAELIAAFQTHALSEQPFPEGKVPEDMYLTPGYAELTRPSAS